MNETNVNEPCDRALERAESAAVASLCTKLSDAQSRTGKLRNSAPPASSPDASWVAEALVELDAAREELRLAEEELHTHAERLCRLQDALGIERRRYREMFDDAPEPYLTTDANGVILETNPRASQLFGLSCLLLSGKPLAQFVAPADRTLFRDALGQLARGGLLPRLTLRIWPLAASESLVVTLSVSGAGRSDRSGHELRWIVHAHEERSEQLAQAVLREASASDAGEAHSTALEQPSVDALDPGARLFRSLIPESRDDLLAIVTHELRDSLGAMESWLALLGDRQSTPRLRERALSVLSRSVRALKNVLEGVDRRAGDTTPPWKCENGPVDLLDVISEVLESCQPAASRADVQLVARFDSGLCSVPADPIRLEHVLRNILSNALAFAPRRGALEVSASTEESFIDIFVREGAGRGPTVRIRTPRAEPARTH